MGLEGDIQGGARLTGQAGPISIGALALRTEGTLDSATNGSGVPAAWNSVLRLQANLRERTTAGVIATSLDRAGGGSNRVAGADFHTRFWSSSAFRVWGARLWDSRAGGSGPGNQAARAELDLENDRYALSLDRVHVGKDFDPALGFLRRRDMDEWSLWGGFRPRFESSGWARRFSVWGGGVRTRGTGGEFQSERLSSNADLLFESGERVSVVVDDRFERLQGPASISGRILPPGDYHFRFWEAYGSTNESRMLSMSFEGSRGGFWSGRRTRYAGSVVVKTGPHLTVGSRIARNRVSLPVADGDFTTTLVAFDITGRGQPQALRRRPRAVGQPFAGTPGEHPGGLDPHSGERPLPGPQHGVHHRRHSRPPARPPVRPLDTAYRSRQADLAEGVLIAPAVRPPRNIRCPAGRFDRAVPPVDAPAAPAYRGVAPDQPQRIEEPE